MSRVNRIALKLMNHRREALKPGHASEAMGKFDYKIPFTNIFGKGVYRTVVPMKSPMQKEVERLVKGLGFDGIDWQKGEATKTLSVSEKAPPGTKPKVTRTNLGKVLGRLPGSEAYLNWWSNNQGVRDENGFSIVISRHPLDVMRMSDFKKPTGEEEEYPEITSCHSSWREHWPSCYNEMKYGGPIAYLVKNKDLGSLNPKQIAGRGEIFADRDRGVPGIRPLSRLRLRRYTNEEKGFDLAVPEVSVYGNPSSDFRNQVINWARESQAEVIGEQRWRVRDFVRKGGSYMNSGESDGMFFNQFFGDRLDSGRTMVYDDAGKGYEARNYRRRQEIEGYSNDWQGQLEHCSVSYDEHDDQDDDEEEVQFYWSGSMSVEIPLNLFVGGEFELAWKESDSLRKALSDKYFYAEEVGGDSWSDSVRIYFDIRDEDAGGDPDGYNDFCSMISSDYDDKYDEVMKVIMDWLYENGHLIASPARQFVEDFENAIHQFQNFHVEWDGEGLLASAEANIGWDDAFYQWGGSKEKFDAAIRWPIQKFVTNEINKIVARQKSTSGYFPGFEPGPPKRETYNTSLFNVEVFTEYRKGAALRIMFGATDLTTQEEVSEIIDLLKIIDQIFPRIVNECKVWLQKYEQQLAKYNELREEKESKGYPYGTFQFDPTRESRRRKRRTTQEIFAQ